MGGEPYEYIVEHQEDFKKALDKLRNEVFENGDFYPSERNPESIEDARMMAMEDGTRSILDIDNISVKPEMCRAAPLTREELLKYYQTEKPSLEVVLAQNIRNEFWLDIGRGTARIVICYENDVPNKLLFAGISFD